VIVLRLGCVLIDDIFHCQLYPVYVDFHILSDEVMFDLVVGLHALDLPTLLKAYSN
jgi:hypothetical protein